MFNSLGQRDKFPIYLGTNVACGVAVDVGFMSYDVCLLTR